MYERFTDRARKVMYLANQEAQRFNHEYVGTEHILLGLLKLGEGIAAHALKNLDIDLRKVRLEVEKIVQPGMVFWGKLPKTPRAKNVIDYAVEEAKQLNHYYVSTEHLLLGLMREEEGVAFQVLWNLEVNTRDLKREVLALMEGDRPKGEQSCSGRELVRRWSRAAKEQGKTAQESCSGPARNDETLSAERERIRSLERQLWNVRVLLGALVGALAGALFAAQLGSVLGLIVGGSMTAFGQRLPAALLGGAAGLLLGTSHLPTEGGGLAGLLLGALTGFLIAEVGSPSSHRK
jgi:hypothetical protein